MILLTQDRKNNHHLVDYCGLAGSKFTICGLSYSKKDIISIVALDNSIHNICKICYTTYEDEFQELLDSDPRIAKGRLLNHLRYKYRNTLMGKDRKNKKWFSSKKYREPISKLKNTYKNAKSGLR